MKSNDSPISNKFIDDIVLFLKAFFYGCKISLLKGIEEEDLKNSAKIKYKYETN